MRYLAILVLLFALPASAQETTSGFELVGFTSSTHLGDVGVLGATLACQVEFTDSRMCNSVEVMQTIDVPSGLAGDAWVRSILGQKGTGDGAYDVPSGVVDDFINLTCAGWTTADPAVGEPDFGLVVSAAGGFTAESCADPRPVACCAAAPSAIMATVPFGSSGPAFLVLALLVVSVAAMGRRRAL